MEAVSYFQSMFTFKSIFSFKSCSPTRFGKSENRLAHALIGDGRESANIAAAEMENGKKALNIAVSEQDENLKKNMANIAAWHYTEAAGKFRRAADEFAQAAKIWRDTKRHEILEGKSQKMIESARHSEAALKFLSQF